ncbi:MAG: inositol monophosphatase [Rhodoferax sp.]|nr:inositol monophosphatase [Rhodoferax sp.]
MLRIQDLHPTLGVALRAARAGADIIRAATGDPAALQIRLKQPNDFVTNVDSASEQAIVNILLTAYPSHCVRGEESQQTHGSAGSDHVWIVDPLDGTANFIHGYPAYSVSVALAVGGQVTHGVVLDAASGRVYHASRGLGAFCDDRRLRVATRSGLDGALVATSCPVRPGPDFAPGMQMLADVMVRVAAIRRSGSAALDLAWTAAGYCDGCFDRGLNAWDVAAGSLLVQEAGGRVCNFRQGADFLEVRECVAGNAAVVEALARILAPYAATDA